MISFRQADLLDQFNEREVDFLFEGITRSETLYIGPWFHDLDHATDKDYAFSRFGTNIVFGLPGYRKDADDRHIVAWDVYSATKAFELAITKNPGYIKSEIEIDPSIYNKYTVKVWFS